MREKEESARVAREKEEAARVAKEKEEDASTNIPTRTSQILSFELVALSFTSIISPPGVPKFWRVI